MKNNLKAKKYLAASFRSIGALAASVVTASKAFAATVAIPESVPKGPSINSLASSIINTLLWAAGIISVIVIIIGGIMYTVSGGNENRTRTAKDAILYAVIGLVISLLAFAIVNFVIGKL